jgi:hypothetical protein
MHVSYGQHSSDTTCHTQSKKVEPKLPYMCLGSYITRTMTHHGKTDAMFDYLNRVIISYINDPMVSKR